MVAGSICIHNIPFYCATLSLARNQVHNILKVVNKTIIIIKFCYGTPKVYSGITYSPLTKTKM